MEMVSYLERVRLARQAVRKRITNQLPRTQELLEKSTSVSELSDAERDTRHAIDKLSAKDKIGVAGEHLAAIGGTAAGVAAAGTIAGAAGATTLLGSGALASIFGGLFVTATPIGWVMGSAALMGAAGYGVAKMIRSGSAQDQIRKEVTQRLIQRLAVLKAEKIAPDCTAELARFIALTLASGSISEASATRLVTLVEAGTLKPQLALERVRSIALASKPLVDA